MTLFSLLLRNLAYFWRGNLAVLLGVLVGSTVLTGALFVGDSLQGSLREQTQRRLGWVDHALVAPRFFRAALAGQVAEQADAHVAPALMLQATCSTGQKIDYRQIRGVTVLGVDASFFGPGEPPDGFDKKDEPARTWLSRATADALAVKIGDTISLQLQKPEAVPREAGLGKKDVALEDWPLVVSGILDADTLGGSFNLRPELQAPRNILVPLPRLQQRLNLPGQANTLLADGNRDQLDKALRTHLTLEDWGLVLHSPASRAKDLVKRYDVDRDGKLDGFEWRGSTRLKGIFMPKYAWAIDAAMSDEVRRRRERSVDDLTDAIYRAFPYLALESKQLLISPTVGNVALEVAKAEELLASPTLVYLCRMQAGERRFAGVVAAMNPSEAAHLGPAPPGIQVPLGDDQIILLDQGWGTPKPGLGSQVVVRFKPPESHGPAPDRVEKFTLSGLVGPIGPAADPFLTPDFPGITDKEDIGAWDLPFDDVDWKKHIATEYGDPYWKQFRGTPKAFITLARGRELWGTKRFGDSTSIRLAPAEITRAGLDRAADRYRAALLKKLEPASGGFVFDSVKASGLEASQGGTPFGLLFLGFSFFLILSALLLVALLSRLNLERRSRQVGVFTAEGFSRATVRQLLLGEGAIVALIGVLLGVVAAILYSRLLVQFLAFMWPGETLRSFLRPHASITSMGWGAVLTVTASVATVFWVVWALSRISPRALLAGQTADEANPEAAKRSGWLPLIASGALLAGIASLVSGFFVHGQEAQAGAFFGSGMLLLTAGLCTVRLWMRRERRGLIEGNGAMSLVRLGVRNAARHPGRSLLVVGLLASASFLIVAVESFRRTAPPGGDIRSPDGGFALLAETDLPVIRDLNSDAGRAELLARLRRRLVEEEGMSAKEAGQEVDRASGLLKDTTIVGFRARAGDDASCLNLYKPKTPRVLGVPNALLERGGFAFDSSSAKTTEEKANPWLILKREEGRPAFGEKNTVMWMLRSGLGGKVAIDDTGDAHAVILAGLLHDSVFQSSLLVSEEQFLRLFPTHEGYHFFLIAPPTGQEDAVKKLLLRALGDRGIEVTSTRERLEAFLAVENTYLSTFQALGGLGLILGSVGLAVVLLRAVWERRSELALLRALGYRNSAVGLLVLAENAFLLLLGLAIGTAAALLSILPQLVRGGGQVPWANLALLFAGVLTLALTAAALATASTLRAPIVPALRRE